MTIARDEPSSATQGTWADRFVFPTILACTLAIVIFAPVLETVSFSSSSLGLILRRFGYPALAVLTIMFLPKPRLPRLNPFPLPVVVTLLWFLASSTWSAVPSVSFVRLALTALVAWLIFSTVIRLRSDRSIAVLRYVTVACLICNFVVVFAYPEIGIMPEEPHYWRGVLTEKNQAGMLCGMTCLFWTLNVPNRLRVLGYIISLLSVIFLTMTWSRTALIMTAVSFLSYALTTFAHGRGVFKNVKTDGFLGVGNIITGIAALAIFYLTFVSNYLPELVSDPNLMSKRGAIWQPMVQTYLDHPIVGTGFGSFWGVGANAKEDFAGAWLYRVSQGHNGYLDIATQTGAIGLLLAMIATLAWPMSEAVKQINRRPERLGLSFAILIFCLGSNISESGLFDRDRLWQVFLMISMAIIYSSKKTSPRGNSSNVLLRKRKLRLNRSKSL